MKFWDASAIIPLCVDQPPTPRLRRLAEKDSALVVWWATPIECYSALARRRREELFTQVEEEQARSTVMHPASTLCVLINDCEKPHP